MHVTNHLAVLRNLRNIVEAEVSPSHMAKLTRALTSDEWQRGATRILPFRYIAAARAAPSLEPIIDTAMQRSLERMEKLPGTTIVLVDTSPSMAVSLSAKSDLSRMDAACGVAILLRGICEEARVFAFSSTTAEVPARSGMALADAILRAVPSNGTLLGSAVAHVARAVPHATRLVVFTDEESQDPVAAPHTLGYMVNVATSQHGVGHGPWERIDGFSEAVVDYIRALEAEPAP